MNTYIVFGVFAFAVAAISLFQVLTGQHDNLLALLRRFWGRKLGHSLYFLSHVAIPVVICVLCLGWGIRHYDTSLVADSDTFDALRLDVEMYREIRQVVPQPVIAYEKDLFLAA